MGTEFLRKGSYRLALCPCMARKDDVVVVGRVEVGKEGDEGADKGPMEFGEKIELLFPLVEEPLLANPEGGVVVYMAAPVEKCWREL